MPSDAARPRVIIWHKSLLLGVYPIHNILNIWHKLTPTGNTRNSASLLIYFLNSTNSCINSKLTISQEVLTISTVIFQCTSPKTLRYFKRLTEYLPCVHACMHARNSLQSWTYTSCKHVSKPVGTRKRDDCSIDLIGIYSGIFTGYRYTGYRYTGYRY
jgi:hypothetical protein